MRISRIGFNLKGELKPGRGKKKEHSAYLGALLPFVGRVGWPRCLYKGAMPLLFPPFLLPSFQHNTQHNNSHHHGSGGTIGIKGHKGDKYQGPKGRQLKYESAKI